jgi:hypothetical protein
MRLVSKFRSHSIQLADDDDTGMTEKIAAPFHVLDPCSDATL